MTHDKPPIDSPPEAVAAPVSLSYAAPQAGGGLTTVSRCRTAEEAAMQVNVLQAAGLFATSVNEATGSLGYGVAVQTEVQVREAEREAAVRVLRLATSDEVEPADGSPPANPVLDANGQPEPLVVIGRYANIRPLRDAATILEAARIQAVLPLLVERGDRPAGTGDRFLLRVRTEDAERAEILLQSEDDDADPDDLRCPRCGSWRTHEVSSFFRLLLSAFGLAPKAVEEVECTACHFRAPKGEFVR